MAGGYLCGLEWDSNLKSGERNAKFDCSGSADPLTLISRSNGNTETIVIRTDNGCGLQWDSNMNGDNERNAKFDCEPAYDEMTLYGMTLPSEYHELRDGRSGKCLDIWGGSAAAGADIRIHSCHDGANQQWKYQQETGYIRSYLNPDYCIANGGEVQQGHKLKLALCEDSDDQRWDYQNNILRSRVNPELVMDAFGQDNGSDVGLWSPHGGNNQNWHIAY